MSPLRLALCLLAVAACVSPLRAAPPDDKLKALLALKADIGKKLAQGDREGAIRLCQEAVEQAGRDFGEKHENAAFFLNELGLLYLADGQLNEAQARFERSLDIRQSAAKPLALNIAVCKSNLGELFRIRDDYAHAEPLFRDCLTTFADLLEKNTSKAQRPDLEWYTANAHINLGKVYELMGEGDRAEKQYRLSLKVLDANPDDHPIHRAFALNNLGWLLHAQGKYDEAEKLVKEALKLRRDKLGADHVDVGESLNNLGLLCHSTRRYDEARGYFEASLKIFTERLGPNHPRVATVENNFAGLLRSMGDPGAEARFRKSLELLTRAGDDRPEVAANRINLAGLYAAAGKWGPAGQEMDLARRILRRHIDRVLSSQSETEQLAFLKTKEQRWLQAALSLGLQKGDDELANRSAAWVLNGKAVGLQVLAQRPVLARDSQDPRAKDLLKRLLQARDQLAALSLSVPVAGQEEQRKTRWEELTKRERDLSRQLGQALGERAPRDVWVELDEVRKALPEDGVLVEIARFEVADFASKGTDWKRLPPHYAAWIIPGRGPVRVVDLGEAKVIDAAVQGYQDELKAFFKFLKDKEGKLTRAEEKESEERFMKPLEKLSKLLLQPLEIDSARRWVISPDAALWLVPWSALPVNGHFAVEDHPISLVATGRDLLPRASEAKPEAPAIFANVDYGEIPKKDPPRLRFPFLDYSLAESEAIAPKLELYAGTAPRMLTDDKATEKAFRALHGPRVLVMSTHGFVRDDATLASRNPLLQCGLALAGANRRRPESKADNDGILFGLEVLDVDLRGTDLVVLSACETALGEVRSGEGVVSLQYAFQLAGARSVVATLWEVPDQQTALISRDFFARLADGKEDKAEALRQAQLARIKERRGLRKSTHPFFWAALTLTGDWK